MALPLDESAVKTMMAPKAATRVAFGTLVECGLIAPGTLLTDSKRRWKAKVRVDGSLDCEGQPAGSNHKGGAGVPGAPSCNGWTFWHVDTGKALRVMDAVRQDLLLVNEARPHSHCGAQSEDALYYHRRVVRAVAGESCASLGLTGREKPS